MTLKKFKVSLKKVIIYGEVLYFIQNDSTTLGECIHTECCFGRILTFHDPKYEENAISRKKAQIFCDEK